MLYRKLFIFVLAALFVVGCTPATTPAIVLPSITPSRTAIPTPVTPSRTALPSRTPSPTSTLHPTLTITLTGTALPPLIGHAWQPQTVLVKLESGGGDGCCFYAPPASLVIYANGRVIVSEGFDQDGNWRYRLKTKLYSRQELCAVLNTIDQTGFLDYDTGSYRPLDSDYFSIDGANSTAITVNSWKSNYGEFYGLMSYLNPGITTSESGDTIWDDPGTPVIPPSLQNIYFFLSTLEPDNTELYLPQRLGLIVTNSTPSAPDSQVAKWPFDDIDLTEVEKFTSGEGYPSEFYIVEGPAAASIYDYFGSSYSSYGESVRQNGRDYVVFIRPLLPYEVPQLDTYNILPDPDVKPPGFQLECYPTDGVLPISTLGTP